MLAKQDFLTDSPRPNATRLPSPDSLDNFRCRAAWDKVYDCHVATTVPDDIGPDDVAWAAGGFGIVVTPFYQNVGLNGMNQFVGGVFREQGDVINNAQCCYDFGAVFFGNDWALHPFQPLHRCVGVHPHHQQIAKPTRFGKVRHMATVKNIEAAVGKDDALPFGVQLLADCSKFGAV